MESVGVDLHEGNNHAKFFLNRYTMLLNIAIMSSRALKFKKGAVVVSQLTDEIESLVYYHGPGKRPQGVANVKFHYCFRVKGVYTPVQISDSMALDHILDCSLTGLMLSLVGN